MSAQIRLDGKTYSRQVKYHGFLGEYVKINGNYYKVKHGEAIREIYIKENEHKLN